MQARSGASRGTTEDARPLLLLIKPQVYGRNEADC